MSRAHLIGPPLPEVRHATILDALEHAASSTSGLTFLDSREQARELTFAEMLDRARRAASALAERGIERGDRVALVLPTGESFMDAFFGTLFAGAIPVPLYPPVRLGRLAEYHARTAAMLRACGAKLLLTDARIGRLLGVAVEAARPALGSLAVEKLMSGARTHLRCQRDASDLALIQFSSGTTIEPKPVALTHANVLSNVAAIDSFVPRDAAQAGVSWLPLYHDMGLIGCLLEAVVRPGPLTLLPPELFLARPALWLRAISRARATISVAPNFAFGLCLKRVRDGDLAGVDLSSWKLALNGAEPISPDVLRRFARRFAKVGFDERALTPVYGLSEASLAVTFAPPWRPFRTRAAPGAAAREIVSVGVPVPGAEVRIADERGETLQQGRVGRILVRSPGVMNGYFQRPGATSEAVRDGWLDSGDLGLVDEGELFLCGREKELVILRGKNHAPQEFEEALEGIDGLRAGCAVAVGYLPTGADGEELAILAEVDERSPRSEEQLAGDIRARLAERTSVRPFEVKLFLPGTLPRTSSGKLRRAEALRQHLAGELRPPRQVSLLGIGGEMARSLAAYARLKLRP